jgi:hypothetical protein
MDNNKESDVVSGAICDLLEHSPSNPEVAKKVLNNECPDCSKHNLIRWCPQSGFHDLCSHFHCLDCDADYCYPIAWSPPMPVVKMKGEICPRDRRYIAKLAKNQNIKVPDWWIPIMQSDLKPVVRKVVLKCYECHNKKETEVIVKAGYYNFGRGKHPRGWFIDRDGAEMYYSDDEKADIILCLCPVCLKGKKEVQNV